VVWTDAIQGIILIIGALVSAVIIVIGMPEGLGQLFQIAAENNKFSLGSFGLNLDAPTFWVVLVYGFFINLQNYGIDQNYIQRYMTASSDREAKRSALFGGLLYIPVSLLFLFIGTALFSYYNANPGLLPEGITGDRVFPYFITNGLPAGITGLLIASIFAAGMSTVSTSVNSSATIILKDFFKEKNGEEASNKKSMTILYTASFIFGTLSIFTAIAMINVQSALEAWWKLASIFSGGMLGLFLLGYFSKKAKNPSAILGVVTGAFVIAWMSLSPMIFKGEMERFASPFHNYLSIVFGTVAIFLVGFVFSDFIFNRRKRK
jgi:SSS family solute:Na+ symporter